MKIKTNSNLPPKIMQALGKPHQVKPTTPHHSGKGTRARLNTVAEKMLFNSKYST